MKKLYTLLALVCFIYTSHAQHYSLDFDGSNDYVSFGSPSGFPTGSSAYTFEAWIYPDAMGARGIIGWGSYGVTNSVNALRLSGTGLRHYWWSNDLDATTGSLTGAWHHVAVTCSSTERKIYLDGALVVSGTVTASVHTVPAPTNLTIGRTNNTEYFDGKINNVRVWTTVRTQAEIQAGMIMVYGSGTTGLAAAYNFNLASGTVLPDMVNPANNNGTLQNFTLSGPTSNWVNQSPMTGILYVKQGGTGNGLSWGNATGDLQAMINASSPNDKVWVAAGEYQRGSGQYFSMKEGVEIYGGFPATGTPVFSDRNRALNETKLKGNNHTVVFNNTTGLTAAAVLDGFTLYNGSGNQGGGIYNYNVSPTLRNLIIRNNNASDEGAGIYNNNGNAEITNVALINNTLGAVGVNTAKRGGGFYNYEGSPTLKNVLVANNTVYGTGGLGGGINIFGGNPMLINVTVTENTAATGSGMYFQGWGSTQIKNAIVWNNNLSLNGNNPMFLNSLVGGSGGSSSWNSACGTNLGDNIDTNPFFVNPTAGNYALDPGSPAVNAGGQYFPNASTSTDLANNPRLFGSAIDLGAYEPQTVVTRRYVKVGGTGTGSGWAQASGNLQGMIDASVAGNEIWVAAGTYQPASGQSFSMKNGVKIYGGFAASGTPSLIDRNWAAYPTVLQGNGNRVIYNDGVSSGNSCLLDGFVVTGGSTIEYGGGMKNVSCFPQVANCIFRTNSADKGGAIYCSGGGARVKNSLFYSNTANYGGAVYEKGSSTIYSSCTFSANYATYDGGGLFTENYGYVTLTECIAWGNTAAGSGKQMISSGPGTVITFTFSNTSNTTADLSGTGAINKDNSVYSDPLFENPSSFDFRIKPASPLLDRGYNIHYPDASTSRDLAGNPRLFNGTIDIGAYEIQVLPPPSTALGINTIEGKANDIIVYKQHGAINITSGTIAMRSVSVYDISGRLLYSGGDSINATETTITTIQAQVQLLIVEVTTIDDAKAVKKIIF